MLLFKKNYAPNQTQELSSNSTTPIFKTCRWSDASLKTPKMETADKIPILSKVMYALALVTLMAAGSYQLLPEKEWVWIPSQPVTAHIYSDGIFGGDSTSNWVNESNYALECDIKQSTNRPSPPFCGVHFHFAEHEATFVDLTGFNRMLIDADYSGGNNKLRFYLNEFVPGFSDPDKPITTRTAKYMGAFVNTDEMAESFEISMDQFVVAEWWINENNVPRQYSAANREHILTFGVDIVFPIALGQHEFTLNRVTFVGDWVSEKSWYLGILLVWVVFLFSAGSIRIFVLLRYNSRLRQERTIYKQLSCVDSLTGLLNRYGLEQYFSDSMQNYSPITMLLLDVDHFKPINDTYGHHIGDVILKRIANMIEAQLRSYDKASRWGGEEFLVLLPNTNTEHALEIAERTRLAIKQIQHPELNGQQVTVSIGVGLLADGDFDAAFSSTDKALYKAKGNGRDRVEASPE